MHDLLDQAVQASEAQRDAAELGRGQFIPALKRCPGCGSIAMIASPALGTCESCGQDFELMAPPAAE